MSWLADLSADMAAKGLLPPGEINADGQLHRFHVEGDRRGTENGWYVVHADAHPTAVFGTWRGAGCKYKWRAERASAVIDEVALQRMRKAAQERKREREAAQKSASKKARELWSKANCIVPEHPYLQEKGVKPFDLGQLGDELVVPVWSHLGVLQSLQFIGLTGKKRFLPGGRAKGGMFILGEMTPRVWLCEGVATGLSLYEDMGETVIVTFSCHNLLEVAMGFKARNGHKMVVMADDDWKTSGNPGLTKAKQVTEAYGWELMLPEFPPGRPDWATDYNDARRLWAEVDAG